MHNFPEIFEQNYDIVLNEIEICSKITEQYPRNYYAWTYRQLVSYHINTPDKIETQLDELKSWIKRHVSDFCAYHYRHFLWERYIYSLHKEIGDFLLNHLNSFPNISGLQIKGFKMDKELSIKFFHFWKSEWMLSHNLIIFYPGHESLWSHRRALLTYWIFFCLIAEDIRELVSSDDVKDSEVLDEDITEINLLNIFMKECKFVRRMILDDGICQYEKNKRFAQRYYAWILFIVSI